MVTLVSAECYPLSFGRTQDYHDLGFTYAPKYHEFSVTIKQLQLVHTAITSPGAAIRSDTRYPANLCKDRVYMLFLTTDIKIRSLCDQNLC